MAAYQLISADRTDRARLGGSAATAGAVGTGAGKRRIE